MDQWLADYSAAWASNTPTAIGDLFTDDAEYRSYPWAEPLRGRDAIVTWWLAAADGPDDHRFHSTLLGVDGARHFVQGRTVYEDGRTYENLWVVELHEDGRASSFTEWYMESSPARALGPKA